MRDALEALLDAQGGSELRRLVTRLDRMAAEVGKIVKMFMCDLVKADW